MKERHWTAILFGGSAALLLSLLVLSSVFSSPPLRLAATEEHVLLSPSPSPTPTPMVVTDVFPLPSPTPVPTAAAPMPKGSVNLLVNGFPLFALDSRDTAVALVTDYLACCAAEPLNDNERLLRAHTGESLSTVAADGSVGLLSYDDALALLLANRVLISVHKTTERLDITESELAQSSYTSEQVPQGSRFYHSYGRTEHTLTATEILYRDGIAYSSVQSFSAPVGSRAATRSVAVGAYLSEDPEREPRKGEGTQGKSSGELNFSMPMRGRISSCFGTRAHRMHYGIDILANAGTTVSAPESGTVVYCQERGAYGFVVEILHENGFLSRLTHLKDVCVELQQHVYKGEAIGVLAEDELAEKPHLHYELLIDNIPYDPLQYLD